MSTAEPRKDHARHAASNGMALLPSSLGGKLAAIAIVCSITLSAASRCAALYALASAMGASLFRTRAAPSQRPARRIAMEVMRTLTLAFAAFSAVTVYFDLDLGAL
eukprot:CAMPEP_0117531344 /NCGR_PEP_ID=MMETSP0784-20121206/38811_1 /TAXON_ID=39447 /ORGANISM="" /LENGTH=105 /DNA_ID=CAMNT_0005327717 /DNA_START=66 /DNA_END=383 /DNA_ORIENTATION=-